MVVAEILAAEARRAGLPTYALHRGAAGAASHALDRAIYRAFRETELSSAMIARLTGFADARPVRDRARRYAASIGEPARTIAELRGARADRPRAVDWVALAYRLAAWREGAGLSPREAAARVGVGLSTWRRVCDGRAVDADSFARLLVGAGIAFETVLLPGAVSRGTIRETATMLEGGAE